MPPFSVMKTDWSQLRHLTRDLNWGNPDFMNGLFMYALDSWCHFTHQDIFITPHGGTLGKHDPKSLHYLGSAIDFVVPNSDWNLFDLFISLNRIPFTEIGIYPQWRYDGHEVGGFHVGMDTRSSFGSYYRKYWLGIKDKTLDKNIYLGINRKNLRQYGVV